jgi:hypothetical protein
MRDRVRVRPSELAALREQPRQARRRRQIDGRDRRAGAPGPGSGLVLDHACFVVDGAMAVRFVSNAVPLRLGD